MAKWSDGYTMQLARFDVDGFLREYWQQKPLLIRNPWNAWHNPLDPDELAGLACEDEVESRLVAGTAESLSLEHGPLREDRFAGLGSAAWTLLVQSVDHHVPAVASLLDQFRFIPNWRVDDVMVSYAADGGGVGPHFDNYDVFLIQGSGRRRWQVGDICDSDTPLSQHPDLRLIEDFQPTSEWVLDPGDMLYLPPRFAHDGVAVGDDCMTYSVGFRAPSREELIAGWTQHALADLSDDDRYRDPALTRQDNPGEISGGALDELHAMATQGLNDPDAFARWFGEYCTAPRNAEIDWRPEQPLTLDELREMLDTGAPLVRNPAARFSFVRRGDDRIVLFVNGESFDCDDATAVFAARLCAAPMVAVDKPAALSTLTLELITALRDRGMIALENED